MEAIPVLLRFEDPGVDRPLLPVSVEIDSEDLPEALVDRGYTLIALHAPPYAAKLPVNDDATFMVDSYEELRTIVRTRPHEAYHSTFLGDGELVVDAWIRDGQVECEIRNCPRLDKQNLTVTRTTIPLRAYAYGWARAVEQLLTAFT